MNYKKFFQTHPVFTIEELRSVFKKDKPSYVHNNLKYYLKKGRIRSIKRGLYYVIPEGASLKEFHPDSLLICSRLDKEAVIGFHSALEMMGYAHSVFHRFFYYSSKRKRKFSFRGEEFISVKIPENLKKKKLEKLGVVEKYYHNLSVRYTNRERTLVDCLDRPGYAGGIEEAYRCLEKYPYLDFKEILDYLDALKKSVLYAKVGFFLQQHREQFYVEEDLLIKLKKNIPASPVYFTPERKKGRFIKEWNLVVPEIVIKRGWEEF